jgi:hypothetical protein
VTAQGPGHDRGKPLFKLAQALTERIVGDQAFHDLGAKLHLVRDAEALEHPRQNVRRPNSHLLISGVPGETKYPEAILEWRRYVRLLVRRGNEKGRIEVQVNIVKKLVLHSVITGRI